MTRKQIMQRQQELLTAAKNENRDLTLEEKAEFDGLQRMLEGMDGTSDQQGQRALTNADGTQRNTGTQRTDTGREDRRGMETGQDIPGQVAAEAQRAIKMERNRVADITALCRSFNMEPDEYIRSGASMDGVRAAVIEQLQRTAAPIAVRVTADEGDKFRARASDALMIRSGLPVEHPADGSGQMRGMSLRDLAIECLAREGEDAGALLRMDRTDLYNELCRQFYNPSAAFPAIMDTTIRKSIVHLYNQVPTTFQAWTTKGSLSDFKETPDHEYVIGGLSDFEEVAENGEIKADVPRTEMLPSRKLKTYGKQFSMTRQAFINDDIGFLTEVPGLYATRAKRTIDKQVYSLLYNNQKIWDGRPLFHGDHKNLMAKGGKPSQQSIQEIILQMQRQTDQFGEAIYMTPRWLVVPVGYEFDLAVILHSTQVTGSTNNDINPLYNYPISIVQTPVLNGLAGENAAPWFMVADPMSARGIQVDYLNGQETPIVRRMESPGVLGFTWDIYTDWGIAIRDFRGIAKNPGEKIA